MDEESGYPVVIDAGSSLLRAGIAGNDTPSCVIPSYIGSLRVSKDRADNFVGDQLQNMQDVRSLRYPIQRGIVTNWDDMEFLMSHCYQDLKVDPKDRPLLYAEPHLNPRSEQERLAQVMFEKFEIPSICVEISSFLCLYACGRNCGVMVNIGDGVSSAVPFYESYCIQGAVHRQDFAGQDVTRYLQKSLQKKGYSFTTPSEFEIVKNIKEKLSYTALDFDVEMTNRSERPDMSYELSDGSSLNMAEERFQCMEVLFQPSNFGFEGVLSIQEMIYKTVESCEIDTKSDILCNIILSGGTVMNNGFTERLRKEMKLLFPRKVNVISYPESPFSVWIGGSILGSLSMFEYCKISKQRYEECGPSVLNVAANPVGRHGISD